MDERGGAGRREEMGVGGSSTSCGTGASSASSSGRTATCQSPLRCSVPREEVGTWKDFSRSASAVRVSWLDAVRVAFHAHPDWPPPSAT